MSGMPSTEESIQLDLTDRIHSGLPIHLTYHRHRCPNSLGQYYRQDSTAVALDSLVMAWRLLRTPAARYAEALTWLEWGEPDSAAATIEALSAEHQLGELEIQEQSRMLALITFVTDVRRSERNVAQLIPEEVETLQGIVGEAYDRPATWAQNMLCFHYGLCIAKWAADRLELEVPTIDEIIKWAQELRGETLIEGGQLVLDSPDLSGKFKSGIPHYYGYRTLDEIVDG